NGDAALISEVGVMKQFITQLWSVVFSAAYVAVVTFVIAIVCRALVGMRAEDEAVSDGLDLASHGERAYDLT
ncbi:MAG: ammonia channel protein, partial [Alphaproteobacteria bacterium]